MNKSGNSRLNPAQKNTVRVALATGATIAVLMGAQTLAFSDKTAAAQNQGQAQVITADTSYSSGDDNTDTTINTNYSSQNSSIYVAPTQPAPVSRSSRGH